MAWRGGWLAAACAIWLASSGVRADWEGPEDPYKECPAGSQEGDKCDNEEYKGTCEKKQCRPDGGARYDCLVCWVPYNDDANGPFGCSAGTWRTTRAVGPWVLAGAVALMVLRVRRRQPGSPA